MRKKYILLLVFCLTLAGCAGEPIARDASHEPHDRTVFAMDTVMNLKVYGGNGENALDAMEQELYRLDALLARGAEGSAVHKLNALGTVNDSTVAYLLAESQKIAEVTDGAFDPTVAPLLELWGFGSGAGEHRVPTEEEIAAALETVGVENIHLEGAQVALERGMVDLGGIAKGWAANRMSELCAGNRAADAVMDLGGEVLVAGSRPDGTDWRVAIKDPAGESAYLGVLETTDTCIMTSGVYERYFEENGVRYHHILDPRTGYPAESGVISATVICKNGVWADALATAVCVMGADKSLAARKNLAHTMPFDLILVTNDGRALYTCDNFTPEAGNNYSYEKVS